MIKRMIDYVKNIFYTLREMDKYLDHQIGHNEIFPDDQ